MASTSTRHHAVLAHQARGALRATLTAWAPGPACRAGHWHASNRAAKVGGGRRERLDGNGVAE